MWADRKPTRFATNTMNDFLRLPSRELVRKLKDKEAFIGEDYPLGTVVHFDEEYLSLGLQAKTTHYINGPVYLRSTHWGVVAQTDYPNPNKTVLMQILDGFVYFERGWVDRSKFLTHEPILEVGKALHIRMTENKHWVASESFNRILAVDIWSIGQGIRKPVNERSALGVLNKLAPHLR